MTTWKDGGDYGRYSREITDEKGRRVICHVRTRQSGYGHGDEPWPDGEANFRLILQAPQMLEALETIRDKADNMMEVRDGSVDWTDWQPVRSTANAAIAAAKPTPDEMLTIIRKGLILGRNIKEFAAQFNMSSILMTRLIRDEIMEGKKHHDDLEG